MYQLKLRKMTNEEFIKSVSLDGEIWKDVVGYEGYYMVSSLGRVFSCKRTIGRANGRSLSVSPKILNHHPLKTGYVRLRLTKGDKKQFPTSVHWLVATSFIDNPNNETEIDHINGIKHDNRVENLRWCSHVQNCNNPITRKFMSESSKTKKNNNVTNAKQIVAISLNDNTIHFFDNITESRKFGFTPTSVCKCCKNKSKSHKGFSFLYLTDYESLINKSKNDLPKTS